MLINRTNMKKFMLEQSKATRNGKFTRVGMDVYPHFEAILRNAVIEFIRCHPTKGKTFKTKDGKRESGED